MEFENRKLNSIVERLDREGLVEQTSLFGQPENADPAPHPTAKDVLLLRGELLNIYSGVEINDYHAEDFLKIATAFTVPEWISSQPEELFNYNAFYLRLRAVGLKLLDVEWTGISQSGEVVRDGRAGLILAAEKRVKNNRLRKSSSEEVNESDSSPLATSLGELKDLIRSAKKELARVDHEYEQERMKIDEAYSQDRKAIADRLQEVFALLGDLSDLKESLITPEGGALV